jgi:hypothetical protein
MKLKATSKKRKIAKKVLEDKEGGEEEEVPTEA